MIFPSISAGTAHPDGARLEVRGQETKVSLRNTKNSRNSRNSKDLVY
jgi:hypothetical protein